MKVCNYCKEELKKESVYQYMWKTPNYPEANNLFEFCSAKCHITHACKFNESTPEELEPVIKACERVAQKQQKEFEELQKKTEALEKQEMQSGPNN